MNEQLWEQLATIMAVKGGRVEQCLSFNVTANDHSNDRG